MVQLLLACASTYIGAFAFCVLYIFVKVDDDADLDDMAAMLAQMQGK